MNEWEKLDDLEARIEQAKRVAANSQAQPSSAIRAAQIAESLNGRRAGEGRWMAKCPCHDDKKPSLSITDRDGKTLVYCHAGCSQEALIEHLRAIGLWAPENRRAAEIRRNSEVYRHAEIVKAIGETEIMSGKDKEWSTEDRKVYEQAQLEMTDQSVDVSEVITKLAELSAIEYEQRREPEANKLGIRVSVLDKEVGKLRAAKNGNDMAGSAVSFEELEPWPHPVHRTELLDELVSTVKRHVVLLAYTPEAIAFWILHAHAHSAASISPLLAITSPDKRCGKSTLLIFLEGVTPRSLLASNLTVATLFRAIEEYRPTLLVDEADTFLKNNEELRGILNSGHIRNGARVLRTVGDNHKLRAFNTWSPKAIALIGNMPPTLMDRSIVIPMRRKRPDEVIERLRLDQMARFKDLARRCARWATDNMEKLRNADPDMPESLHDRAADNWRPLLAIAEVAGGDWPKRAREAAKVLTAGDDGESAGVLLLRDLQDLFKERDIDRIASAELVEALIKMEERPWPEWKAGKPITQRQIARLLKPFEITPKQIRIGDKTQKGYYQDDCSDPFSRYLGNQSETTKQSLKNRDCHNFQSETRDTDVSDRKGQKSLEIGGCFAVSDETPESGGSGKVVGVTI